MASLSNLYSCDRYNTYIIKNETLFIITRAYEGIPQNIVINISCYIVLISLFMFLRKKAWNYGMLAWLIKPVNIVAVATYTESFDHSEPQIAPNVKPMKMNMTRRVSRKIVRIIPLFIRMSDRYLAKRCGSDAVTYCIFQRYLILTVFVMMFFSLTVILPLNLYGGFLQNSSDFVTLTIKNVKPENQALWVHFTVTLLLMIFSFCISHYFLEMIDVGTKELDNTIMISNVPRRSNRESLLQKHFEEAFPSVTVVRIQVTYKVDKLIDIYQKKCSAEDALAYCYKELENGNKPVIVVPHACGRVLICHCCHCSKPVDGYDYYFNEVIRLNKLFYEEKAVALNCQKLPIVFVTFASTDDALLVIKDYMYQNYSCLFKGKKHKSSKSRYLKSSQWKVVLAPTEEDIIWSNLHKINWIWWIPMISANLFVGVIVIIMSTQAMILNLINYFNIPNALKVLRNPIVAQCVPTLILVLFNSLIPTIVFWSAELSGYWTNTYKNIAIMNKLYLVLLTTVLILPSLGLTSIPEMIKWLLPKKKSDQYPNQFQWECIFMPDGGALFCNYLITASFIGTGLELLRCGELFIFFCKMCCSKSRAEDYSIAQKVLWEFQFGLGYAWTLALFAMISAYAVVVPIITPFGLLYLILKHSVDRYNMVHVNIRSKIHKTVHANAAHLMQLSIVLAQATVTIFVVLRRRSADSLSICCYMAFILGILLLFGRTIKRWIMSLSCIKYSFLWNRECVVSAAITTDKSYVGKDSVRGVDDETRSSFIPRQITLDEPVNIDDILARKGIVSSSSTQTSTGTRKFLNTL